MRGGVIESSRQCAGAPALPVSQLGVQQTRRAGPEEQPDAMGSIPATGVRNRIQEPVLRQRQLGHPVVAAIGRCHLPRQRVELLIGDVTDPGVETRTLERARHEATAPAFESRQVRAQATPRLLVKVNALRVRGFNRDKKGGAALLAPRYNSAL